MTMPDTSAPTSDSSARPPRPRGKVFDVMRPGKAPAPPTSRPVVIGHKPEAQQRQVSVSGIGEPNELLNPKKKVEFVPPYKTESAEALPASAVVAEATPAGPTAGTASLPHAPQPANAPSTETSGEDHHEAPMASSHPAPTVAADPESGASQSTPAAPENDDLANLAMEPEPAQPTPTQPEQPPAPAPEPPANDPMHGVAAPSLKHQVVVSPHGVAPQSVGRIVLLAVLVLLFALLILDILLDAGIISSSAIPHTHFF